MDVRAVAHDVRMANSQLPDACDRQAQIQSGVITRRQAIDSGMSADSVHWLVQTGRWRALQRGVYSINSGEPVRLAVLWAAVLRMGPGAALSHESAAELHRLSDAPSSRIHVSIPHDRTVAQVRGLVLHRSRTLARATHPTDLPPRTKIEETVLDLVHQAPSFEKAFAVGCTACQRRLTTPARIQRAMDMRSKLRWRDELAVAMADIGSGVHSLLEYRYVRDVERPHGLPTPLRQARIVLDGRVRYLDNLYEEFGVCVELDGREAHPDDRRWLDKRRDNATAARGLVTLRYGWTDVTSHRCETAAQTARTLQSRGWTGQLRPCGPNCTASASSAR